MGERSVTPTIYQTILESMGEGIIFVDAEDRLAFINNTAENIRGIKAVNFIGRNLVSIHSPRTAERIDSLLTSTLKTVPYISHAGLSRSRGNTLKTATIPSVRLMASIWAPC